MKLKQLIAAVVLMGIASASFAGQPPPVVADPGIAFANINEIRSMMSKEQLKEVDATIRSANGTLIEFAPDSDSEKYLKGLWDRTSITVNAGMNGGFGDSETELSNRLGATFAAEIAPGVFVTVTPTVGMEGFNLSANISKKIIDRDDVDVAVGAGIFVGTDGFSVGPNLEITHGTKGYGVMLIPLSSGIGDAVRIIEIYKGQKRYHSTSPLTIGMGEILGGRTALDALGLHLPLGFVGVIVEFIHEEFSCKTPNFMMGELGLITMKYDDKNEALVGRDSEGKTILAIEAKEVVTPWFFETIFQTEEEYFADYGYPVADDDRIYLKDGSGYYGCTGELFAMNGNVLAPYTPEPEEKLQPLIEGGVLGEIFGTVELFPDNERGVDRPFK